MGYMHIVALGEVWDSPLKKTGSDLALTYGQEPEYLQRHRIDLG